MKKIVFLMLAVAAMAFACPNGQCEKTKCGCSGQQGSSQCSK